MNAIFKRFASKYYDGIAFDTRVGIIGYHGTTWRWIALTHRGWVGITSVALSALVTQADSAVRLIKRHTPIRPCQHHSHPQKELFAFLSLFLLLAEDTHIMEIRVVPRMKIENSECCPGSPPLASDNRSIECREPAPHSGHLPPLLSPLPDWAFTRSAVVPHALPLSPAPLPLPFLT